MVQKITKNKLYIFNILFNISFNRKVDKTAIQRYSQDIDSDVNRFSVRIKIIKTKYPRINTENLIQLYTTAIYFRHNKKLIKSLFHTILSNLLVIAGLSLPYIIPHLFNISFKPWEYFVIYILSFLLTFFAGSIVISGIEFIQNFSVKIGKLFSRLIEIVFIALLLSLILYISDLQDSLIKAILLSAYYIFLSVATFNFLRIILFETIIDALYFSKKIQITDELILESSYRLSRINWQNAVRQKSKRQMAINEIERLANLLENDWSNHILTGDERTHRWKLKTLTGIASNIRKIKQQIILPSIETPENLKNQFNNIFEKLLIHDLQSLINEEVAASRFRKKSTLKIIQSILVAILPLTLTLCLKHFAPEFIDKNTLHVTIIISGLWLLISVILWLDPNLADKLATVKSFKSMLNQSEEN